MTEVPSWARPVNYEGPSSLETPQQKKPTPVVYAPQPPVVAQDASAGGGGRAQDWMANYVKMRMAQQRAAQGQTTSQQPGGTPSLTLGINTAAGGGGKPMYSPVQAGGPTPGYRPTFQQGGYQPTATSAVDQYAKQQREALQAQTGPVLGPPVPPGYHAPMAPSVPAAQMDYLKQSNINPTQAPTLRSDPTGLYNQSMAAKANAQPFIQFQERQAADAKAARDALDASRNYSFRMQDYARDYGNLMSHLKVQAPKEVSQQGQGGYGYYPWGGYGGWGGGYGGYGSYSGSSPSWFLSLFTWKI
jgi:hypothetical protein